MTALLRSELFRLSRRLMPRILLVILAALIIVIYLILWVIVRNPPPETSARELDDLRSSIELDGVRETGLDLVRQVGSVLGVILGASIISTEFTSGTIRTILPRATGRSPFLTAKLLTLLLFVVLVVVLGFLVALLASGLVTALEDLDSDVGAGFAGSSLAAMGRTAFVMLPYVAFSFMVALWTRSTAVGIGIGLSILFLEGLAGSLMTAIGGPLARVPEALLSENVRAITEANDRGDDSAFLPPDNGLPGIWRAAGVLTLYTAAFIALAYWRFRSRDITGGGE